MNKLRIVFVFCISILTGILPAAAQTVTDPARINTAAPLGSGPLLPGQTSRDDRYRIGFQDILDVQVFRHPDLSQRVPVSPAGTIVLFRLDHPVIAVCKTERELATVIEAAYKEKYLRDPQVRVFVAEQKSQSVAVIGAVEHPNNYYVTRKVHLLEMLAMAGGPNKESGTRLLVARTGSSSNCKAAGEHVDNDEQIALFGFKIRDIQEGKATLWMQPGDVVSVLDADIVYVYGNVNKQGALKIRDPITLTQAIATAEGLKPATRKDHVRIIRQKPGSIDREEFVFDLNQIDKGKVKDPYLEPNDIVAVSEDKTKAILLGLANAIKSSVPSALYRLPL